MRNHRRIIRYCEGRTASVNEPLQRAPFESKQVLCMWRARYCLPLMGLGRGAIEQDYKSCWEPLLCGPYVNYKFYNTIVYGFQTCFYKSRLNYKIHEFWLVQNDRTAVLNKLGLLYIRGTIVPDSWWIRIDFTVYTKVDKSEIKTPRFGRLSVDYESGISDVTNRTKSNVGLIELTRT